MLRAPEGGSERAGRGTAEGATREPRCCGGPEGAEAGSRRAVQDSRAPYYASGASLAGVRFSREASTWFEFGFGFGFWFGYWFELGVGVGVALSLSLSLP